MNNKHKVGFIVVLSGALLFAAALANAQGIGDRNRASGVKGGVYSIQGRVLLPDGKPAKDVKVSISSTDTNTSVTTDRDGEFHGEALRCSSVSRVPSKVACLCRRQNNVSVVAKVPFSIGRLTAEDASAVAGSALCSYVEGSPYAVRRRVPRGKGGTEVGDDGPEVGAL